MSFPSATIQVWAAGLLWIRVIVGPSGHLGVEGLGCTKPLPRDDRWPVLVLVEMMVVVWSASDHFLEASGNKNCSPAHLVTHERGLGEKESHGQLMMLWRNAEKTSTD